MNVTSFLPANCFNGGSGTPSNFDSYFDLLVTAGVGIMAQRLTPQISAAGLFMLVKLVGMVDAQMATYSVSPNGGVDSGECSLPDKKKFTQNPTTTVSLQLEHNRAFKRLPEPLKTNAYRYLGQVNNLLNDNGITVRFLNVNFESKKGLSGESGEAPVGQTVMLDKNAFGVYFDFQRGKLDPVHMVRAFIHELEHVKLHLKGFPYGLDMNPKRPILRGLLIDKNTASQWVNEIGHQLFYSEIRQLGVYPGKRGFQNITTAIEDPFDSLRVKKSFSNWSQIWKESLLQTFNTLIEIKALAQSELPSNSKRLKALKNKIKTTLYDDLGHRQMANHIYQSAEQIYKRIKDRLENESFGELVTAVFNMVHIAIAELNNKVFSPQNLPEIPAELKGMKIEFPSQIKTSPPYSNEGQTSCGDLRIKVSPVYYE